MSLSEFVNWPNVVPLTPSTSPSKVKLASPFKVLLPLAVSTLLLASLLMVIVPAVNAAKEADTEVKSVRDRSAKAGVESFCRSRISIDVCATPFVDKDSVPWIGGANNAEAETIPDGIFWRSLYSVDKAPTVVLILANEAETLPHCCILTSEPVIACSDRILPVKIWISLAASPNTFEPELYNMEEDT